jgi:hypothetical protein
MNAELEAKLYATLIRLAEATENQNRILARLIQPLESTAYIQLTRLAESVSNHNKILKTTALIVHQLIEPLKSIAETVVEQTFTGSITERPKDKRK